MKKEEEINVLDELNKGSCMGIDAIKYAISKVKDGNFCKILKEQSNKYQEISNKINKLYPLDDKKPHETNAIDKAMTWYGIQIETINDKSDSKIAELLIKGTNMGIIEGRKLLNNKNTTKKVNLLIQEYVTMQEEAVEKLKSFL